MPAPAGSWPEPGSVDAVVAADTPMLVLAATVAAAMGLPHNPVDAVRAALDKAAQRQRWAAAGVPQPSFRLVPAGDCVRQAAEAVGFPCVVKAVSLSASQGVLRADDPAAAVEAARRIRQVLDDAERPADEPLLIEEYLPGPELSIDGVLTAGDLTVTAVFDKPGMPDGPTFEETLLVSPSRLAAGTLAAAVRTAADAARALGLSTGPVHAELRICDRGPAMLELAPRSIGGLCSRALRFPGGASLEEIVLANALGRPVPAGGGPAAPCGDVHAPGAAPRRPARGRGPGRRPGRARCHRADDHDPARPAGPPAPGRRPLPGLRLRRGRHPGRRRGGAHRRRRPAARGHSVTVTPSGLPPIIVSIARPPERKNRTSSAAASSRNTMLRIVV